MVQEIELELETSTRENVDFGNDRSAVQSPKHLNRRDKIQVLVRGCEVGSCWETTGVFEVKESSPYKAEYFQVPDNCTSVVSVVHQGNSSCECRLQVLSLARVAEFERENSSKIPIEGLFVAVSTRERDQLSCFTEVIQVIEVCSVNDTMKQAFTIRE